MRYLRNQWDEKSVGLQDVSVLSQLRATDEDVATIDAAVEAFFSGKGKIVGPFDEHGKIRKFGNDIAGSKKAPKQIKYRDPENPKTIRYRYENTDATTAHIHTATLCTRDDRGSDETLEGEPIKPYVHLVFEDGSQADVEVVGGKTKHKKSDKPSDDGKK